MIFGRRLPAIVQYLSERNAVSLWLVVVMLFALLAGCGGGSSDPVDTGPNPTDPTISGTITDSNANNAPLVGATVTIRRGDGTVAGTAVTNGSGNFSLQISPTTSPVRAQVTAPANVQIFFSAFGNSVPFDIRTGVEIPALAAQQTFTLLIQVFSQEGGPPPPPL